MKQGQLLRSFMEAALSAPLFCTRADRKFVLTSFSRRKNESGSALAAFIHTHTPRRVEVKLSFIVGPSASNQTLVLAKFRLLF